MTLQDWICWCSFGFLLIVSNYSHCQQFEDSSQLIFPPHTYGGMAEMGGGVNVVDFNKDGCDDLTLVTDYGLPMKFYLGDCQGNFSAVNLNGINHDGLAKHALWVDVDNDDDFDLFIGCNDSGNKLFIQESDFNFVDVTDSCGIDPSEDNNTIGCVAADFNVDGNIDFYVTSRTIGGFYTPISNQMFYGNGEGFFTDVTAESNTQDSLEAPLCPVVTDYDKNGFPDIYIAQDKNYGNTMLKNENGLVFESVAEDTGTFYVMNGMNAELVDINNDGYEDIYVTNSYYGNKLLVNQGDGTFEDEGEERGIAMFDDFCWGGTFGDIDNDMDQDLYVCVSFLSAPDQDRFFVNDGNGYFTEQTQTEGLGNIVEMSFGNLFNDFNHDGYPELVVNNHDADSRYFINQGGTNNYFTYELEGTESNRDAIGALVNVYTQGQFQLISHACGQGWLSQKSYTKTVGLGSSLYPDSIIVEWPSGIVDKYYNVLSEGHYEFVEGETFQPEIVFDSETYCPGETAIVSFSALHMDSVVWGNGLVQNSIELSNPGTFSGTVFNGPLSQEFSFDISFLNPLFSYQWSNGFDICPGEFLADLTLEVNSESAYSIYWDGVEGEEFVSLDIGNHSVQVVDEHNCILEEDFQISTSELIELIPQVNHASCFGQEDGQIILGISGADPFEISLNGNEAALFNPDLSAGTYAYVISDANGCEIQDEFNILEPDSMQFDITTHPDYGGSEGSVIIHDISGGTSPYYLDEAEVFEFNELEQGVYNFELCDSNDCCSDIETEVEFQIGIEEIMNQSLTLYPNPVIDRLHINSEKITFSADQLVIKNNIGQEVSVNLVSISDREIIFDVSHLSSGMYILENIVTNEKTSFIIK